MILAAVTFVVGVLVGLMWASVKGAPPGLEQAAGPPAGMTQAAMPMPQEAGSEQGDERAKAILEQLEKSPGDVKLYIAAGNAYFDNGAFDKAVEYYSKALEIGGPNADVITDMGIAYRGLGRPDDAIEQFRRARQVDPRHVNFRIQPWSGPFSRPGQPKGRRGGMEGIPGPGT